MYHPFFDVAENDKVFAKARFTGHPNDEFNQARKGLIPAAMRLRELKEDAKTPPEMLRAAEAALVAAKVPLVALYDEIKADGVRESSETRANKDIDAINDAISAVLGIDARRVG